MRPRAERCERLSVGELRPLVEPGAECHTLTDGTELQLCWAPVRGCFGGKGHALVMRCPGCAAHARVLWRPEGREWRCWRCEPISHRSHRRPGSRRGRPKPVRWRLAQIAAEQRRIAALLALRHWPPQRLLWDYRSLGLEARRSDAPRLSAEREWALTLRVDALENLRLALLLPQIDAGLRELGQALPEWPQRERGVTGSRRVLAATAWAMRRPAGDPRNTRSGVTGTTGGITSQSVFDCNTSEVSDSEDAGLARSKTTVSVPSVATAKGHADDSATETKRLGADAGNARGSRVVSQVGESSGNHRQRSAAGVPGDRGRSGQRPGSGIHDLSNTA